MYPLGILAGLLLLYSFLSVSNFNTAIADGKAAHTSYVSGHLRAYGSYVAAYARANPSADGGVSDAAVGVPSWLEKPPGMAGYVTGGRAFVYITPSTIAEANAIARKCGGSLLCGVTRSSSLFVPGAMSPVSVALPSSIPANGALVLVF